MHSKRIHMIDEIRGFCVMCMVLHHSMYTLGYMYNLSTAKLLFDFFTIISPAFAFAFIMMCGISCTLSSSNLRRGVRIFLAAEAVTVVSYFVVPYAPIDFGILHLLGVCVMLYAIFQKAIDKIPPLAGIPLCIALFVLTQNVDCGYLGIEGLFTVSLPSELYSHNGFAFAGFVSPYQSYSDYFPMLPWMFAFLIGVFIGNKINGRFPKFMYKSRIKPLSALGTNAFLIYVIHQPIIYGISYLLTTLINGGK